MAAKFTGGLAPLGTNRCSFVPWKLWFESCWKRIQVSQRSRSGTTWRRDAAARRCFFTGSKWFTRCVFFLGKIFGYLAYLILCVCVCKLYYNVYIYMYIYTHAICVYIYITHTCTMIIFYIYIAFVPSLSYVHHDINLTSTEGTQFYDPNWCR